MIFLFFEFAYCALFSNEITEKSFSFMDNFEPVHAYALVDSFSIEGDVTEVSPFGSGHINDTYRVLTDSPTAKHYLLQRVNHHVFKDVPAVMQNMQLVTQHLKAKYRSAGDDCWQLEEKVLTLIPTKGGSPYLRDESGNYWRMLILLADTRSYDIVETPQQAHEGGRAFGRFQRMLADLDVNLIREVLPDFHHIGSRLDKLKRAVAADKMGRVRQADDELAFIWAREKRMHAILDSAASGLLPVRITHNDTKFNNVLLDMDDRAQCVIDLDTVMPGYVAYDFGDAIRTIINSAAEDETDLRKIQLNIPLFSAYAVGYFEEAHPFLTQAEIDSLIDGVLLLPFMQAVRFLTDFLEGDHYYKIHHPDHNLQRTRTQVQLVKELEAHEQALGGIIREVSSRFG